MTNGKRIFVFAAVVAAAAVAGYAAAGAISSVDLLGKSRYYGNCLDIGCMESQVGGMALIVR